MHLAARPPLARILLIDRAIRAGTWPNARTLADQLEVNERTVRRDITHLRDRLGAPLEFDPVRNGYRYTEPSYRLPFFQLTEGELVALLLAGRLLGSYRGTPFEQDLRRAFARITEMLPEAVSVRLDALSDCLAVLPETRTDYDPEIFASLAAAVVGRKRVEMVYWTAGRDATASRVFDPYHLMLNGEDFHVVGQCHTRDEVRVFKVLRVRSVRETGEAFDRPADFRVEDYMSNCFRTVRGEGHHHVELRFRREFAGRIAEKVWHSSQSVERMEDGGLILRFEVSDLREIIRFAMHWGSECRAMEPAELREAIYRECQAMMAWHDDALAAPE